jgi:tetratricopeptide (TPR) repeat protein
VYVQARTGELVTSFDDFGALLRFLRRRARLTQRQLGLQVGYSEGHICRLEQNDRLPEPTAIAALFVPVLRPDPATAARLIGLARQSRDKNVVDRPAAPESRIPAPSPHTVDRPDALARVRDLLATERAVVIRGLAGVGKTTLAAAVASEYVARGAPLCWITLSTAVGTSPEALVRQLARHLAGQGRPGLAPLLERREGVPPLPLDHQIDLLASALIADSGPAVDSSTADSILVCLDNAQALRGQDATLAILTHLGATAPVSLLLTSREPLALPGSAAFRLDGLRRAEALQLVANIDPGLPAALADRLLARTAGYPMLLRLALGQTCQPGVDRAALVEHLSTNPEITAYLLETTLDRLGSAAERLVSLLAVCRTPVDLYDETLVEESQAADGPYDLLDGLDELRRRQLVDDPAAATLHPLVRDQIHARLVGQLTRRRRLHGAVAIWYERVRDDVLEAAWHFGRAGEYARSAEVLADRVRTLIGGGQSLPAADLVIDTLAAVGRRPESDAELARRLLVLRGDLLVDTLRAEEAESAYREALALSAPPAVRAAVARRLAVSLLQRSQVREALTLSVDASALLGVGDTLLRAELAATEAQARLQLSEHDEAMRVAERALAWETELAAITPESAAEVAASAHWVIGVVLRLRRRDEEAAEHLSTAAATARRAGCTIWPGAACSISERSASSRATSPGPARSWMRAPTRCVGPATASALPACRTVSR